MSESKGDTNITNDENTATAAATPDPVTEEGNGTSYFSFFKRLFTKQNVPSTSNSDQKTLATTDGTPSSDEKTSFWGSLWPWSGRESPSQGESISNTETETQKDNLSTPVSITSVPTVNNVVSPEPVSPTPIPSLPPKEKSQNMATLTWPWSSNQGETTDKRKSQPAAAPAAPEQQQAPQFSTRVAEFARKTLPDTLLAITPWANPAKGAQTEKATSISHHEKGGQLGDIQLSIPPKHRGLFSSWKSKAELETPWKNKRKSVPKSRPRLDDDGLITLRPVTSLPDHQERLLEEFYIPENLAADVRIPKSPESNWSAAFQYLASLAAGDERYDSRRVVVFKHKWDFGDLSSGSSEGSPVPSTVNLAPFIPNVRRSTPYMYSHRPFRMPKLAARDEVQDSGMDNQFRFDPVQITPADWPNAEDGSDTSLVATKWAFPEPIRADKQLLPEIDPLVRYKFQKLRKNRVTPEELLNTQKKLELGLSPSGRKLDEYSSGSEEECVYQRVMCKDDPEFDVLEPHVETASGDRWPNPFLFYWNWKRTDTNANENYLEQSHINKDDELYEKQRIALELDNDPLKIPYQNLGADDTDYEDPLGPFSFTPVTVVLDKFQNWWKTRGAAAGSRHGSSIAMQNPVSRRYSYVLVPQYSTVYQKYHQLKLLILSQNRKIKKICRGIRGKYTTSCSTCCQYPTWYSLWKGPGRYLMRRVPRTWKFVKDKNIRTVFYGTFSSLYATQYIAEYDLLPNMDDPVRISQEALEKALKIKELFFVAAKSKSERSHVDYIKMQNSKSYKEYVECISLMCRFQPIKMPPRVRKAFFLNFFNVLSIQTQILRVPERQNTRYLWEINDFWEKTKGLVGYIEFSLEEIYHGILRCNRIHPLKQVKVFEENSVKGFPKEMCPTRLALDWMDPRIHFALSVGCKSCPPILIFSLYEQDYQLNEMAKTFVRSKVKINLDRRLVTLPILFLWYERDFGNNKYVMLWYLKQFMLSKDMLKIRQLLTSGKTIRLRYERPDEEIDHTTRRHLAPHCKPPLQRAKIIPVYWGSKF